MNNLPQCAQNSYRLTQLFLLGVIREISLRGQSDKILKRLGMSSCLADAIKKPRLSGRTMWVIAHIKDCKYKIMLIEQSISSGDRCKKPCVVTGIYLHGLIRSHCYYLCLFLDLYSYKIVIAEIHEGKNSNQVAVIVQQIICAEGGQLHQGLVCRQWPSTERQCLAGGSAASEDSAIVQLPLRQRFESIQSAQKQRSSRLG